MICPYCGKKAKWCENKEVYGRNYGKSFMCYYCKDCDAYVGCHNNTERPLGTMANKELREWRIKAHKAIDGLWKSGIYKRKEVYQDLNKAIGNGTTVHIGASNIEICKRIIERYLIIN